MDAIQLWLVVGAGVASNLLFAVMFLARIRRPSAAHPIGLAGTAMAVPLAIAAGIAWGAGDEAWDVALPLVFVAFAGIEVLVDVVLADFEVRTSRWLGPYLGAFYLAQWAVIGAAFRLSEPGGFAVLTSYFACLAATVVSYRRIGHGVEADPTREASPSR